MRASSARREERDGRPESKQRRLTRTPPKHQLFFGTASVVLANVLAAWGTLGDRILSSSAAGAVASAILLGPFLGWWRAYSRNELEGALGILVPGTALCVIPLAVWIRSRKPWLLAVVALFWFLSGHYFAIGMWI